MGSQRVRHNWATFIFIFYLYHDDSIQFSHSVVSDSLRPHESQHARPPCPSQATRVYPNSRPSSRWCHPAISPSVIPFSSCPQSLPASSASVLPMNIQDWSPLGWTGWISLQSKWLSSLLQNPVQKHPFFSAQLSSQSNSHIHTWPLESHNDICLQIYFCNLVSSLLIHMSFISFS